MTDDVYYAYGVIPEESLDIEVDGVCGTTRAFTVTHRTLSAVVGEIDTMEPEQTDENAKAHDEVLRDVMLFGEGRPVVPMQFGMTFKNGRTLKHVLRSGRRAFTRALRNVEGKVELGVSVVSDAESDLDAEATRDRFGEAFTDISVESTEDDLYSDRLVLNRSYLVEQSNQSAFDDTVDELRAEYDDATVRYTGPWAPYNFVDIEIEAEG